MQKISVSLTLAELESTVSMMDNQLFRMKFIDSKLPGHRTDPDKVRVSASAVGILQEAYKKAKGFASKGAA